MRKLYELDNEGFIKKEDGVCSFTDKDSSLQKGRLKIVHPFLFIRLKESVKIDFNVAVYADNLVSPINEKCSINYIVEKKKISLGDIIPDIDEFVKEESISF
ncbi:hypothetical protein SAMN05720473_11354 [Fibrobacter sp. UWB15]|uniref:hypothetical protein n=1 Tax=unclassified Fibrobacter TaxID=2634177 RepID=UPI0009158433|nr:MULTISPECIES: hypothetical protein [unclassified Fibrobacter]PWJ61977.1 hypothetical protein BGW99_11454 [Fibrobacter sp. UWB6]SHG56736.1 hypothetical protein SAMN05720760_1151 [Fibrobacter sp. UWB8]SMG42444.1 hypothetical protein SAMN05720473_11354 [Fibrobacter sp. UWB15]